ncbi:unnamed protein product [Ectocarpus sp. 12 AP-2014]
MPAPPAHEFSSQPRPVKTRPHKKQQLRQHVLVGSGGSGKGNTGARHDPFFPINIHHDPRVARGNTFAGDRRDAPPSAEPGPKTVAKKSRKHLGQSRSRGSSSSFFDTRASQPVLREELDLSRYLVEPGGAAARPEREADTQTDDFQERPQTPDFVPKKTGVDAWTQIEVSDKLFDFEAEVQPMLAVLVGKTLEQARIEVEREHELLFIREAATALVHQRAEEAQQVLELKQAAVEAEKKKEELRRRQREEANRRRLAKEKVACLQLVRQVLPLSLDRAFEQLSVKSWETQSVQQIKKVFLPWLFGRVAADVGQRSSVLDALDSVLESVDETAETARIQRIQDRDREAETRREAAREARERVIRLFVPGEMVGGEEGERLGPVAVKAGETVKAAEAKVASWLAKERETEELEVPQGGFLGGYLREARRNGGGRRVGQESMLLDLQAMLGAPRDEVVLRSNFEGTQ